MTSRDSKRKRANRAFCRAADRRGRSPPHAHDQRASRAYHAAMARQGKKLKAKRRAEIAASVRRKLQRAQRRVGGKDDYSARLLRRVGSIPKDVNLEFGGETADSAALIGAAMTDIASGRTTPHQNAVAEPSGDRHTTLCASRA